MSSGRRVAGIVAAKLLQQHGAQLIAKRLRLNPAALPASMHELQKHSDNRKVPEDLLGLRLFVMVPW